MSWTIVIWSMLAAACLTLAAIHLPLWIRDRAAWPSLFFSLLCLGSAGLTVGEAWMMHARSPQEYAGVLRWTHLPIWLAVVSLVAFIRFYLGAGRAWLAWTVIGLRTFSLLPNFLSGVSLNFSELPALRYIQFFGDRVAVPAGVPSPWMALGQLSLWLCILFVVDASVTAWRRGERGKALGMGAGSAFFLVASAVQGALIVWAGWEVPVTNGLLFLAIVAVMAYELSRDLLSTHRLALQLGESEQQMVLAARAANVGVWSRDLVRKETWASSQWRELFGFTATERVTAEGLVARLHPDDRDRVRRIMSDSVEAPGVYQTECRVLLPGGGVRWVMAQGHVEFDSRGRAVRSRGASMDCTTRKLAEEETRLLRQEIAHVGRVSVMGQLASGLAHEINQPLGAILRNAEAAALYLQQEHPDLAEIRAILEDIRKDDQRAGAVIDRMRSLLRRQEVEMRPLAVDELFGDVATLLRPEAAARHVRLDVKVDRDVPLVAGDRVHLQQVLLNLVSNGMDAIDEGGRGARTIVVSARQDGAQAVEIAVSDSGRGIAANDNQRLFEPFFTTKPKGMGIGLSISRTIVEAHGGRLWAESHESGARFLFTVPRATESPP